MTATLDHAEIRARCAELAQDFAQPPQQRERQWAQEFLRRFYECFGGRPHQWQWEESLRSKKGGSAKYPDAMLPGLLLVEMKSAGADLQAAREQAFGYLPRLSEDWLPEYVLVSDFARLWLYDRQSGERLAAVALSDLAQQIEPFLFLAGYEKIAEAQSEKLNEQAATILGTLHNAMRAVGYGGKDLETYLIRLLYCLFADHTGIFGFDGVFRRYLRNHTREDGSDLHGALSRLFDTLNRVQHEAQARAFPQAERRLSNLPEELQQFPYVNGQLFAGTLAQCHFDARARERLLACAEFDWSAISPDIFGVLFQNIMHHDDQGTLQKIEQAQREGRSARRTIEETITLSGGLFGAEQEIARTVTRSVADEELEDLARQVRRRQHGAHYTSERNILKVTDALFLEDLREELRAAGQNARALETFRHKLAALNFFDPACGCGNFLVVAYREIRRLETEALRRADTAIPADGLLTLVRCQVSQCYGIEIDEGAAHIARLALWLTDHQCNIELGRALGGFALRLPLTHSAHILCANALRTRWEEVIAPARCHFILSNPPYVGAKFMTRTQREDIQSVLGSVPGFGVLDYVTAWVARAAHFMQQNTQIRAGLVCTNSITQGEQVGILWPVLLAQGIQIHFAHRTFAWHNEGSGMAHVHCVIIGFGLGTRAHKTIFDYGEDIAGEPRRQRAKTINPYLVDAPNFTLSRRAQPLCQVPPIKFGNQPIDGGHLLLSEPERRELLRLEPKARKWIRPYLGAEEFLNGQKRWCLWLLGATPKELRAMPEVVKRLRAVRKYRQESLRAATQELAQTPSVFAFISHIERQPYILIPAVSSERRRFIPMDFVAPKTIASNACLVIHGARLYHFGVLCSTMHNAWVRYTCGRLESRYRYSNTIVYNNFPWPYCRPTGRAAQQEARMVRLCSAIEATAQAILDARARYADSSLADLYDPQSMPPDLARAHRENDRAVDAAYQYDGKAEDASRVTFLFERYGEWAQGAVAAPAIPAPLDSRAIADSEQAA